MPKVFLVVAVDDCRPVGAILDLDRLPEGVKNATVTHWCDQTMKAAIWFASDLPRAARITCELRTGQLSDEARWFYSDLSSFIENCPPSSEGNEDRVLFARDGNAEFARISTPAAERSYQLMREGLVRLESYWE